MTECMWDTIERGVVPPGMKLRQYRRQPRIYVIDDFITDDECAHMIGLSASKMQPAETVDVDTGETAYVSARSNSMDWVDPDVDQTIINIDSRICQVIGLPTGHGTRFNVLRYEIGQEYQPHNDYFDPAIPGLKSLLAERGQRFMTVLLYLSDVEEGGETFFPMVAFKFKPKKRSCLIFYNVLPDGRVDPLSLHGSAPVVKGEKWLASMWIMER